MESTMSLQFCDLQWCACNLVSLKLSKTQHVTWTSSIWIFEGLEKKPKYNLLTNKCFVFNIYSHFIHDIQSLYIYIYEHLCTLSTDILFDFKAVFWDIYHENLRTASSFLPNNANDCFFLCQKTCVYAKIAALMCLEN